MRDVYLYDALRTPRGKARAGGGLAQLAPQQLVGTLVDALRARSGNAVDSAEALLLGCVTQSGAQGGHMAHIARLYAGLPDHMSAQTINNYCASSLSAIGSGIARVASGQADVVLAGGVESMSRVPFMSDAATFYSDPDMPPGTRFVPPALGADRLAESSGISRAELDAAALSSQRKAAESDADPLLQRSRINAGSLSGEECIRPDTSAESLAKLPPAFGALQADFATALEGAAFAPSHTLSHAPPVCDGAGLALISAGNPDLHPRARVVAFAEIGGDPAASLTAGFAAMDKVLARAGMTLEQIDRIEFMEAFAVTIARFLRDYPVDPARVNPSGGHLAKGHPMGASGAILTSTLLDMLDAADGRFGMVVVTGAMGVGAAMIVERLSGAA